MKTEIIQAPNPILRKVCAEITKFEPELKIVADEMFAALALCTEPKGIGLAANQVGFAIRLIVLAVPGWPQMAMCNPVIEQAKGEDWDWEMCLSVPGIRVRVMRTRKIRVSYRDLEGHTQIMNAQGLLARCIQHEIDHLDGKLLSDHLK